MEINFTYLIEIVYHAPRIAQTVRHELMSSLARSYQFIKNLATRKKHFSYERPPPSRSTAQVIARKWEFKKVTRRLEKVWITSSNGTLVFVIRV